MGKDDHKNSSDNVTMDVFSIETGETVNSESNMENKTTSATKSGTVSPHSSGRLMS